MKSTIDLESGLCRLELSGQDGRINEFSLGGEVLIQSTRQLFALSFRNISGEQIILSSNDFENFEARNIVDGVFMKFSEHPDYDDIKVSVRVKSLGNSFKFHTAVSGQDKRFMLEWFSCPEVVVDGRLKGRGGDGFIFQPLYEGLLIDDPWKRQGRYPVSFPSDAAAGIYPGTAQMQFLAYYNDRAGLYYAAHDNTHATKVVEIEAFEDDEVRLVIETFTGGGETEGYSAPFEMVLAGFHGDWMEAAEIYRNWAVTDPHLPSRLADDPTVPEWLEESPVTIFAPVRGNGKDTGEMEANEYFPYSNLLPAVKEYSGEFDSPVMLMLMHWEGTAPWAPPFVWPPYGGEESLAELRDALHASGNLLGVYCSGTAWTQTSSIDSSYSMEKLFYEENLRTEMCRGPQGEIDAVICNGPPGVAQRQGYDCCVSRDWTKETISTEMRKLAEFGIDYAQTFDQNIGGAAPLCYSRKHDHPAVPGNWQTEEMLKLCCEIKSKVAAAGSGMSMGCEAGAAQPYIKYMRINDSRYSFAFANDLMPVPAYSYVFHEYLNNFQGNQCGINLVFDVHEVPENILYRTAYAFNAGDMLSLVLKNDNEIHWGWVYDWDEPAPEQENIRSLIGNLNYWRRNEGKPYLIYGKMRKPLVKITGAEEFTIKHIDDEKADFDVESLLSSTWQAPDGTEAQFIVNYLPVKQKIQLIPPAGTTISVLRMNGTQYGGIGCMDITVPALEAVMVTVNDD